MKYACALASLLCCTLLSATAASAGEAPQSIAAALQRAQAAHLPVLIDFQAQWCYSCYFMATHVLTGPQWLAAEKRVVFIETDADSPDGAHWMEKLGVRALPSYVVLDSGGNEMGRILAEQPRAKFYPALERILGGGDKLDSLKAQAAKGSMSALADALASYDARNQVQAGLDWYATLPPARLKAAEADRKAATWHARLEMQKAAKDKNVPQCIAAGRRVLAGDVGCDRYYVLDALLACSGKLADGERKSLLGAQRPALNTLLDREVFVANPVCVDQRTAVLVAADLDKALGDDVAEREVLARGIAAAQHAIGGDLSKDRNAADNLRVYLLRAGRTADVDALMPKLIAAYPDDYVYPYRYGHSLLERGKAAEALPYLEQAAAKAFGVNRLGIASLRVKALIALHRRGDAEKVAADALAANGPWFPQAAARLKAALKS
ncbi:MAG: thioredoxin family protein [Rudaea sp.]